MRPSKMLRTFSTKLSSRFTYTSSSSSSSITPWPPVRSEFDVWLASELNRLRIHPNLYSTSTWLSNSLSIAISSQKIASKSINDDASISPENYIDDTIELLDACQVVQKRIEEIQSYTNSINTALHCLQGQIQPTKFSISRAKHVLDASTCIEKRCADFDTCGSSLRKLGGRMVAVKEQERKNGCLVGSQAIALVAIMTANVALSFRSRRGVSVANYGQRSSNSWGGAIWELQKEVKEEFEKRRRDGVVMEELRGVVEMTRELRSLLGEEEGGGEIGDLVREMKMRVVELESGVEEIEGRIGDLYRGLIDVRMCLLGRISNV